MAGPNGCSGRTCPWGEQARSGLSIGHIGRRHGVAVAACDSFAPAANCGFVTVRARHDAKHVGEKGGRGWAWQEWGEEKSGKMQGGENCGCLACSRRVVSYLVPISADGIIIPKGKQERGKRESHMRRARASLSSLLLYFPFFFSPALYIQIILSVSPPLPLFWVYSVTFLFPTASHPLTDSTTLVPLCITGSPPRATNPEAALSGRLH